jgi:hypothetical protein
VTGTAVEEWLAAAAWVAAVTGVGSLIWTVLKQRETKKVIEGFEAGLKKFGKVIASYEKTIKSFERELKQRGAGKPADRELEKRKLELEERRQEWEELKAIGGAVKYVYEEARKTLDDEPL